MARRSIKVFLDTCVLRYSVDRVTRIFKVADEFVSPDGTRVKGPFHQIADVNPNDRLDPKQKKEADALPVIAHLAKKGRIQFLWEMEIEWELVGCSHIGDHPSRMWGAPIEVVEPPLNYERVFAGFDFTGVLATKYPKLSRADRWAMDFFENIHDKRFKELQRACGAYQGATTRLSEMMDAFHVYCAEHADADFFLTVDRKLIRHVRNHKSYPPKVELVSPTELLSRLKRRSPRIVMDILSFRPTDGCQAAIDGRQ